MTKPRYEIYPEPTWEIFDEHDARNVAVFGSEEQAREYLIYLNAKAQK
jgi:hypothetical protein